MRPRRGQTCVAVSRVEYWLSEVTILSPFGDVNPARSPRGRRQETGCVLRTLQRESRLLFPLQDTVAQFRGLQ